MKRDQKFFDMYSVVIGLLAIFALAIFVLSMKMSSLTQDDFSASGEEYRATIAERLRPVGQVYLPGEELSAGEPQVPAVDTPQPVAATLSGPQVFNQSCNVCHGAGIGGAPMLSNKDNWAARIETGVDTLKDHAINGYNGSVGYMPPKGGNASLSDDEIRAAVDFMVGEAQKE